MPIYEYRCAKCNDLVEVIQKMSDPPLRKCKKCSGKMEKQFSRTAFQLKGEGWFASGYSKPGDKSDGAAEAKADTDSKAGAKTDSKSDSKTEAKPKPDAAKAGSGSASGTKGKPTAASA